MELRGEVEGLDGDDEIGGVCGSVMDDGSCVRGVVVGEDAAAAGVVAARKRRVVAV